MTKHLNQIPKAEWTLWERAYARKRPHHFYKICDNWNANDRDFMAYWNGRLQAALAEAGHPSARQVRDITWWMDPVIRECRDTTSVPVRRGTEYDIATLEAFEKLSWDEMEALRECGVGYHEKYANAVATRWDSLTQDERDAVRGMTDDDKAARHEFESMTPEERADMRLESLKQEAEYLGNRAGSYFAANVAKPGRGENWLRVMIALGCVFDGSHGEIRNGRFWDVEEHEAVPWSDEKFSKDWWDANRRGLWTGNAVRRAITLAPYTAEEARKSAKIWSGWNPFADILDRLEKRGMVGRVPPEVLDAYNEDMGLVASPALSPQVPPETPSEATASCELPVDIAYAVASGDWAKVARLAQKRAQGG